MKEQIAAKHSNIIAVTVGAVLLIAIAVAAYFFPAAIKVGGMFSSRAVVDCTSPLTYPDASDPRGLRPACGTSY